MSRLRKLRKDHCSRRMAQRTNVSGRMCLQCPKGHSISGLASSITASACWRKHDQHIVPPQHGKLTKFQADALELSTQIGQSTASAQCHRVRKSRHSLRNMSLDITRYTWTTAAATNPQHDNSNRRLKRSHAAAHEAHKSRRQASLAAQAPRQTAMPTRIASRAGTPCNTCISSLAT